MHLDLSVNLGLEDQTIHAIRSMLNDVAHQLVVEYRRGASDEVAARVIAAIRAELIPLIVQQNKELFTMAGELDALTVQVQQTTELEQSAIVLIQGLAQKIIDAGTDPAKLAALTTELQTSAQGLADAVTANTPAA